MAHRLSPASKIVAVTAFVFIVVLTPREWIVTFIGYAIVLGIVLLAVGVRPARMARSLVLEVPFVAFALLLPLVGPDPSGFAGLSIAGMWAAWNILILLPVRQDAGLRAYLDEKILWQAGRRTSEECHGGCRTSLLCLPSPACRCF